MQELNPPTPYLVGAKRVSTQTSVLRTGHLNRLTRSLAQMDSWCLREEHVVTYIFMLQHDGSSKSAPHQTFNMLFGPSASKTELYKFVQWPALSISLFVM